MNRFKSNLQNILRSSNLGKGNPALALSQRHLFMKKIHLKNLKSMENWLSEQGKWDEALASAFKLIHQGLDSLPDSGQQQMKSLMTLPLPLEIQEGPCSIALYSDGGCRGNPGPGAYAYVVQHISGEVLAEGMEYEALTTNNRMELSGPLKGLGELLEILPLKGIDPKDTKIKVITDSKYVVEGMKSWVFGWKARGWKKADNKTPENLELWKSLDEVRNKFLQVEWMWVKGHAGHAQNEYCDRRANEIMDDHLSS
jgi:ribonuclease HI